MNGAPLPIFFIRRSWSANRKINAFSLQQCHAKRASAQREPPTAAGGGCGIPKQAPPPPRRPHLHSCTWYIYTHDMALHSCPLHASWLVHPPPNTVVPTAAFISIMRTRREGERVSRQPPTAAAEGPLINLPTSLPPLSSPPPRVYFYALLFFFPPTILYSSQRGVSPLQNFVESLSSISPSRREED